LIENHEEKITMSEIYFTEDHEWILVEGDIGTCGISEFAQEQLGDIVYVELPEPGRLVAQNDEMAVVESVKAASEIYAPVSGEVTESNEELADDPARINADAMGEGWFFKIRISDAMELDDLLDKAAYDVLTTGQR
jgi:glycine cleavage system H protein